jgi:hypothetical protein
VNEVFDVRHMPSPAARGSDAAIIQRRSDAAQIPNA